MSMRRRGFTALEVLIASAVSVVVVVAALGLLGFVNRMSRLSEERYEDVSELGILHETIRRAMQTLVAEPPPDQAGGAGAGADEPPPGDQDQQQPAEGEQDEADPQSAAADRDKADRSGVSKQVRRNPFSGSVGLGGPRFLLEPMIPGRIGPDDPRRLEVVLLEQPAPGPIAISPTVRGVFDLVPQVDGLALRWRSLNPPGEPIILATRIRDLRWTALAREFSEDRFKAGSSAWRTDLQASIPKEYPKAVRLELVTMNNTRVDWLFEPAVTTGPEP